MLWSMSQRIDPTRLSIILVLNLYITLFFLCVRPHQTAQFKKPNIS